MTSFLARMADLAYRRRGRMVLAWIAAAVVIIGVGSSLAGEYNADYNTPGSESKAASDLTEQRFDGYSGQEIYVVWKDPAGARSRDARKRVDAFLAQAQRVDHVGAPTPTAASAPSWPTPRRSTTSPQRRRSASPTTARSARPRCR